MSEEDDFLPPPPEFENAPEWAHAMWRQSRKDQHKNGNQFMALQGDIREVKKAIGVEPDSMGQGGRGLLGDVRILMTLRSRAMGFIAAIGLTGALLIAGIVHWLQSFLMKGPAHQ